MIDARNRRTLRRFIAAGALAAALMPSLASAQEKPPSLAEAYNTTARQLYADLTKQQELIATSELRIGSANPREKNIPVRLTISGVVRRDLIPDKKGMTTF